MNVRVSVCFFVVPFIAVLAACQPAPTPALQSTPTPKINTPTAVRATATPALPAIKIAVQAPLSGEQRDLGEAIRNGAQLAAKQFSQPIRDLGYNVVVVPFDDQARAETGASNAKKLVADPEIMVVIGHLNTPVALAALDTYKDANLALISPASTDPKLTARALPIVNRVIGRDDMQGPAGAEFAAKELKAKSVSIVADKTTFGAATALAFRNRAITLGLNPSAMDSAADSAGFEAIINTIKAANPDLVYFSGSYDLAAKFLRQLRAKGVKANFLAPETIDTADFARLAGDDAVGVYYGTPVGQVDNYPDAAQFARDYRAEFGKPAEPFAAQAYDATALALQAIERVLKGAPRPSRQAVANAIRATSQYKGITGAISFDANGDLTTAKYFFFQVGSADPQKWLDNKLFKTLELAPNLP